MNTLDGMVASKSCVQCGDVFEPRSWNAIYCDMCRPDRQKAREYMRGYMHERRKDPLIKEQQREYKKKWRDEHPDYMREYHKNNYVPHPRVLLTDKEKLEKRHESAKRSRELHHEHVLEKKRQWAQANPEKVRVQRKASRHKRRAII